MIAVRELRDILSEPAVAHETALKPEYHPTYTRWRALCSCGWLAPVAYGVQPRAQGSAQWHVQQVGA